MAHGRARALCRPRPQPGCLRRIRPCEEGGSRSPDRAVPPTLFLLGLKDRRVPSPQGVAMAEALRAAGLQRRRARLIRYIQESDAQAPFLRA